MTAQIVIDDGTNPPVIGSSDELGSFLGVAHTLSNFDDTGVLAWRWTLVDKPIGSSAALSSTTVATPTVTPDVAGSYLVRLETYSDAGATTLDGADEQVLGVRFLTPFDWLIPAAGETTQQSSSRGWAGSREEAIRALQAFLAGPGLAYRSGNVVAAGPYTAVSSERVYYDPSGGTFQINAPATPVLGARFSVKNVTSDSTAVTISGNGQNIESPAAVMGASFSLSAPNDSYDFEFNGNNWYIV